MNIGTNIFDRDWDVLIILDACRYDLFEEYAPNHEVYSYFDDVQSIRSVASMTTNWLRRTFDDIPTNLLQNTHYVSGAGQSERCLDEGDFYQIDHVWKYALDPDYGQTQPEAITDAAISAIRTSSADQIIVHYTEPHAPFLHCVGKYESRGLEPGGTQNVWAGLENGIYDRNEIWDDYGQNLLRVLDEVEAIIRNSEGKIVVTSDHGNAMGEWGIYGHPANVPINVIRNVPWAETDGLGEHTYEVKGRGHMTTEAKTPSVEEHLQALGYV